MFLIASALNSSARDNTQGDLMGMLASPQAKSVRLFGTTCSKMKYLIAGPSPVVARELILNPTRIVIFSLIGGVLTRIGNVIYNGSLKMQLSRVRENLYKE